jgi:hypothetical protein
MKYTIVSLGIAILGRRISPIPENVHPQARTTQHRSLQRTGHAACALAMRHGAKTGK